MEADLAWKLDRRGATGAQEARGGVRAPHVVVRALPWGPPGKAGAMPSRRLASPWRLPG